nr:putative holin-like toxin [Paenibacillus zanthoxyli]
MRVTISLLRLFHVYQALSLMIMFSMFVLALLTYLNRNR